VLYLKVDYEIKFKGGPYLGRNYHQIQYMFLISDHVAKFVSELFTITERSSTTGDDVSEYF